MSTKNTIDAAKNGPSDEVEAIISFLKANPNKVMSLSEMCLGAGVDAKSGYLRSVRNILGDNFATSPDGVIVMTPKKVNGYSYVPTDADAAK